MSKSEFENFQNKKSRCSIEPVAFFILKILEFCKF